MGKITFKIYDYKSKASNELILALYQKVFNLDMKADFDFWLAGDNADSIGIIAMDSEIDKIVGHFGTAKQISIIKSKKVPSRLSMGFMVDSDYRGLGIATELSNRLFDYITEKYDAAFVIGIPNINSVNMHEKMMGYKVVKEFNFVTIPKITEVFDCDYFKIEEIGDNQLYDNLQNHLLHDFNNLNWRYGDKKYLKYKDNKGHIYISVQFKGKIDILYWSEECAEENIMAFASYLYKEFKASKVSSWNSCPWMDSLEKDEREYYFAIKPLRSNMDDCFDKWLYYMGDCELF
ncbi:MAG: GNAT family N-acetyltransferase [Anaerovoracaceae bacterium]